MSDPTATRRLLAACSLLLSYPDQATVDRCTALKHDPSCMAKVESTGDAYLIAATGLAVLAFLVVPALVTRPARATVAVAVGAAIALGSWLDPLLTIAVLAILHNATPVGFLAERDDVRARALPACAVAFIAVPLLIATGRPAAGLAALGLAAPDAGPASAGALADHLRVFVPPAWLGTARAVDVF